MDLLASSWLWYAFTLGAGAFFAPCAFPLLPGYVSYYVGTSAGEGDAGHQQVSTATVLRAVGVALLVSLGFFAVYGLLGGVVVALGTRYLQHIAILELVVGALMILLGAAMAAGVKVSLQQVVLPERERSASGYVAFGVVYAAAAAGCTAPLFFSVVLGALTTDPGAGIARLVAYAAGMSVLMILLTVATAVGRDVLVRRLTRNTGRITRAAGALLVVAGVYQIYLFFVEFDGAALLGLA
ncbi:cytochrome c biogenesis CcdA family protein [Haloarchaeobius amylolyticus]|uniref:cytochrome c biogenesis CcdA family protein n=1 Tax=Haloarchaeobius amylolyticus TaxID=1198296 RepID=UPI0022706074|nr:cytochrome c biogenesis protein CcdA [Haloarchaeobius amylolyticus]